MNNIVLGERDKADGGSPFQRPTVCYNNFATDSSSRCDLTLLLAKLIYQHAPTTSIAVFPLCPQKSFQTLIFFSQNMKFWHVQASISMKIKRY